MPRDPRRMLAGNDALTVYRYKVISELNKNNTARIKTKNVLTEAVPITIDIRIV